MDSNRFEIVRQEILNKLKAARKKIKGTEAVEIEWTDEELEMLVQSGHPKMLELYAIAMMKKRDDDN